MAKAKKKLSEIKDALMSGTSFMNNSVPLIEKTKKSEQVVEIDKSIFSKLKVLGNYYKKEPAELVHEAINHFLRLKKLDIDEALKNMVIGASDDE
jgi:hypothetical protein